MTHRLTTNYAKNYCNRTLIVKVIVENVVTCFFGTRCTCKTRSSSAVTLARPSVSSSLQIPTAVLDMHHLTCGIISLLHSVNLIPFTVLLVHLILRAPPYHSPHLRYRYLLLPFTRSRLKTHMFHKFFPPETSWFILDCLHGSRTCTEWALAFTSFFFIFFCFWLRMLAYTHFI